MARMRGLVAAVLLTAAGSGAATASARMLLDPESERAATIQLDRDRPRERVVPQLKRLTAEFSRRRAIVEDSCRGRTLRHPLTSYHDYLAVESVQVDRRGRPELFATGSSGASGRLQYATVARFDRGGPRSRCGARLRVLFRYPSRRTRYEPPSGYAIGGSFSELRQFSRRYAGLELRLTESLHDDDDPSCCPSKRRVSYWRYAGGKAKRYVRFRSTVRAVEARD